jgi:hypothetical protein
MEKILPDHAYVSPNYQQQLREIHSSTEWGNTGTNYWKKIDKIADSMGVRNFLDYGAGHGSLKKRLKKELPGKYRVKEYEPGRKETNFRPDPHKLVVCCDVLEHVEPILIDNVLDELQRITLSQGFFTVSTRLANRKLPDGRNAHLIVQPLEWWTEKLEARFKILNIVAEETGGTYFVGPL